MADEELSLDDLFEARDHYSFSQINTFIRCAYQYLFRYILGYKIPPPSALVFGSTTHEALEYNFKQKIESHQDVELSKVQGAWANQWDLNLKKNVGMEFAEDETKDSMLDEGIKLITNYHELVAPTIQPLVVEEPFPDNLIIPGISKPIVGRIDLIDDKDFIIDHKTSKKSPTQDTINKDGQLTMYSMAYKEKYKELPKGLRMDYLVRTKKPQYPQYPTTRTEAHIEAFKVTLVQVVRAIEAGIFYPNPHNYLCSEKSCGFWKFCEGGKIKVNY